MIKIYHTINMLYTIKIDYTMNILYIIKIIKSIVLRIAVCMFVTYNTEACRQFVKLTFFKPATNKKLTV